MKQHVLSLENLESRTVLSSVVAIVDSGADISHPYLSDRLWTNPGEIAGDNVDNDNNGYVDDIHGWNFVDNNNNVSDGYGHGTAVAGLIVSNNTSSIMVLRFQNNQGLGFTGEAIKAIEYATLMKKEYGVNVSAINASWGGGLGYSSLLYAAINNAGINDIAFVVAAGNSGSDTDAVPRYPGSYDSSNIINVAAVTDQNYLTSYSNYGKKSVDLGAPANGVNTTFPNNTYRYFAGTSAAAPRVSSAVGYLKSQNPSWNIDEVKSYIFSTVEKNNSLADRSVSGGVLNKSLVFNVSQPIKTPVSISMPVISTPIGNVEILSLKRIKGWAFSENRGNKSVVVSVVINDVVVKSGTANGYRGDLRKVLGSSYHGFNMKLAPRWFKSGENSVRVVVDGNSIWSGKVYK
jgi:subtilisin family serine protease